MRRVFGPLLLIVSVSASLAWAEDWPQWRGPARTGISAEKGLLEKWSEEGPTVRWKRTDIGTGYSSPAIAGGRVYLQTTREGDEFAVALDEQTGKDVWSTRIGKVGENRGPQYPGTRSTPTLDAGHLYCLASAGELVCLSAADGKPVWTRNLATEFEGKPGLWAYTESVLVDGDLVVCTPGGTKASLAALDKKTGKTVWEASVPDGGSAEYASIMTFGTGDDKQYVTFVRRGLVGVSAKTGKFLWAFEKTIDPGANIITPVLEGNRIFSAGGRTAGGTIEIVADGGNFTPREVYLAKALSVGLGGVVLHEGHLYGTTGQSMFCANFKTGEILWTERALGAASLALADGKLYVRGHQSGDVALVSPNPKGYTEISRLKQPERSSSPAWPHPVVANAGLYLRDQATLVCYELKTR